MLPALRGVQQAAAIRAFSVEALVAQFDSNPFGVSRALRQLRDLDPGRFQEASLRAIADMAENSGIGFVAKLVPLTEPILELIANPKAFEQAQARRILEVMRRIDNQTEAKLLRLISANPAKPMPPQMSDRILELVDAVSDGPRLVPVLMQLFRSANPYVRARLSLSIGKHHRNKVWLEDRMRDPDPRVRANAVEANWQHKDAAAQTLFATALRDTHHRVIANGAVGLYYAGDLRSLRVLGELLDHEDPTCRASGLWAIGHLQDTRFLDAMTAPTDEKDGTVLRSFVVAQARLKRALALRDEQPKLNLRLIKATHQPLPQTPSPATGDAPILFRNHVFLEVLNPDGTAPLQGLKAMQFHIFENDEAILEYSVQERTSHGKHGSYDLYFDAATKAQEVDGKATTVRHLRVVVLTECANGEHDSYDFGDAEPKSAETPAAEPVHAWNAFAVK